MSEPRRIQRSRAAGWRMPENTVYVGRGSRWGNRFRVEDHADAAEAVMMFEHDLTKAAVFHEEAYDDYIRPLIGKNLACWCPLDAPCHADVLLRLAREFACEQIEERADG